MSENVIFREKDEGGRVMVTLTKYEERKPWWGWTCMGRDRQVISGRIRI